MKKSGERRRGRLLPPPPPAPQPPGPAPLSGSGDVAPISRRLKRKNRRSKTFQQVEVDPAL